MKITNSLIVLPDSEINLHDFNTSSTDGFSNEKDAKQQMDNDIKQLVKLQEKLHAGNQYSVLIILQAMDAAGKDGVIKHVMSGLNPQGCNVTSFKHPTDKEYEHDFFWRYNKTLPERGQIGIFNRSYYENVLICRVHPELVLNEQLPEFNTPEKLTSQFWKNRFKQIKRFEKNLTENGVVILKFFLHISKTEQRNRLLKRINNPDKHWKFDFADINERTYWDTYMTCYEEAIQATSTNYAPWYIIPADHKWFARAAIADILAKKLEKLNLSYPKITKSKKAKLMDAKKRLESEK